jgi:hypothetical protein
MKTGKKTAAGLFILTLVLIAGCTGVDDGLDDYETPMPNETQHETTMPNENQQYPTTLPDNNDPSEVAAVVEGQKITEGDVRGLEQAALQQDIQLSREAALEELINQKIVFAMAKSQGYALEKAQVEQIIESELAQQGMSLEEYAQELELAGTPYETQLERIIMDMSIQNYLSAVFEETDFNVSDEEAKAAYDMYAQGAQGEIQPYETVKEQIKSEMRQQKQGEAIDALLKELRQKADIEYMT